MIERRWFGPLYMFTVTGAFSLLVIGFARATDERVMANAQLAMERAVLQVVPSVYDEQANRLELHRMFVEQISPPDEGSGGAYVFKKDGQVEAYAIPFDGQGFWAPIKGIIGVKADRKTVSGIAFYEQNETPGLGAEIAQEPFRGQFVGKVVAGRGKPLNMRRPGETSGESEYNAVTGATQTSTRLESIINDALSRWRDELDRRGAQQ